jgi:hypothetical protein
MKYVAAADDDVGTADANATDVDTANAAAGVMLMKIRKEPK